MTVASVAAAAHHVPVREPVAAVKEEVIGRLRQSGAAVFNGIGALVVPIIAVVGVTVAVVTAVRSGGTPAALLWCGAALAAPGLAQRSWDCARFGVRALRPRRGTIALAGDELIIRDSWFLVRPLRLSRSEIAAVRRSTGRSELRARRSLGVVKQDWSYEPNLAIELRHSRRFPEVVGRVGLSKLQLQPISRGTPSDVVMFLVADPDRCAADATAWLQAKQTPDERRRKDPTAPGCLDDLQHASLMFALFVGIALATAGFIAAR